MPPTISDIIEWIVYLKAENLFLCNISRILFFKNEIDFIFTYFTHYFDFKSKYEIHS